MAQNISYEEQLAKETLNIPLKTYGNTGDVANLISFLLLEKSAHVNGTNILLDGGESNSY